MLWFAKAVAFAWRDDLSCARLPILLSMPDPFVVV
jgi:hypothetical protein